MTQAKTKKQMTVEEFLALPDDGVRRWLVGGEVREYGLVEPGTSVRVPEHGRATARISQILGNWLDARPSPRGEIVAGDAGFRLPGGTGTVVGLDVAYIDDGLAGQSSGGRLWEGIPLLAIEVLSPHDTMGFIWDRVKILLSAGVAAVWIIDLYDQTVRVRRKGSLTQTFDNDEELSGEPELPGFRVPVASLFTRG